MSEALLGILTILYVVFALNDAYVAWRLVPPAVRRPHIDVLSGAAVSAVCVAVGGTIGAVLGLNGILVALGLPRVIPQETALILFAVALGTPSAGKLYMLRLIRRWDRQRARPHLHSRDSEPFSHPHRRSTDPPEGTPEV